MYFLGGWYSQASFDTFKYVLSKKDYFIIKKNYNLVTLYIYIYTYLFPHTQKTRNILV